MIVKHGPVAIAVHRLADGTWRYRYRDPATGKTLSVQSRSEETIQAKAKATAKRLSAAMRGDVTISRAEYDRLRALDQAELDGGEPVSVVLAAYVRSARDISRRTLRERRARIERLAEHLGDPGIRAVTAEQLGDWLYSRQDWSQRTRGNARADLLLLWRWARLQGYLPDATTAAEKTEPIRSPEAKREILTPAQLQSALAAARPEYLPVLLLQAFAGIRSHELFPTRSARDRRPLLWSSILWDERYIDMPAETAKTRRRRLIPIQDNLLQWLLPYRRHVGQISPKSSIAERGETIRLAAAIGLDRWPSNCLRHSYGTYRMAVCRDAPRVSEEMGNSAQIVRAHYDRVELPEAGKTWFSIVPQHPLQNATGWTEGGPRRRKS